MSRLPTRRWTAVTGDINRANALQSEFGKSMRPDDNICHGNWLDEGFLGEEKYDTVLADYLLGAIDGFAPYFQGRLFRRLKRHVEQKLYVVGLEPIPVYSPDPGGRIVTEISNLRDAHIRLANHRCYREYPMTWVQKNLEDTGYEVLKAATFPIRYGKKKINAQLDVCIQKLKFMQNDSLKEALMGRTNKLRLKALSHVDKNGPISFGFDYVLSAVPKHI